MDSSSAPGTSTFYHQLSGWWSLQIRFAPKAPKLRFLIQVEHCAVGFCWRSAVEGVLYG
jgi:hypothetical protein